MPTIKKIRKLIKSQENGLNSSKSSEDDDISVKTDDEKPVSEEDILESLGLKHVARTPDGKIDHAKLSMKDRMAIVRGMQKLNSLSKRQDQCISNILHNFSVSAETCRIQLVWYFSQKSCM